MTHPTGSLVPYRANKTRPTYTNSVVKIKLAGRFQYKALKKIMAMANCTLKLSKISRFLDLPAFELIIQMHELRFKELDQEKCSKSATFRLIK